MANLKGKTKIQADAGISLPAESASRALQIDGSGNIASSAVTTTELGYVAGVTSAIQTQIAAKAASADLTAHISNATGAHAASAISNTAAGNLVATNVQTALNELQSDIDTRALSTDLTAHISNATGAHAASAISSVASGNLAAINVQTALNELQSDIDTRALDSAVIKKDGSVAFTAAQSMGGFKLTSLAAPTVSSDAATKGYVDSSLEGLKPKQAVRVASTANIAVATGLVNLAVVDGITLATGDRVLLKDQTAPAENGIYIVAATGAASRSTDFDSVSPIDEVNKAYVAVQQGTANAGKLFVQFGTVTTLGTDAINFTFFNSVSGLVGGDGVTVSGSNISIDHDGEGLIFVATQLALELDGTTLSKSATGLKLGNTAATVGTFGTSSAVPTITVDQQGRITASSSTSIDHDALLNFVANEHIDHTAVVLSGAANGGIASTIGDISASRSISVDINNAVAETSPAAADLLLIYDASATALRKMTRSNFLSGISVASAGDINETSFAAANNVAAAANVTGLAFANAVVRSFTAQVSVFIDATTDLYEQFELRGIQKGAAWDLAVTSVGDNSQIVFSITTAGQVQYTSANLAGFVSNAMRFRAMTLSV